MIVKKNYVKEIINFFSLIAVVFITQALTTAMFVYNTNGAVEMSGWCGKEGRTRGVDSVVFMGDKRGGGTRTKRVGENIGTRLKGDRCPVG